MELSVLIFTINGQEKLDRILPGLSSIGDELVIGIDDSTTDDTAAVARRYTDEIHAVSHEGFCAAKQGVPTVLEEMMARCRGDWVLSIDHDESLSSLWRDRAYVRALLQDRYATHYLIPRRWVVPPGDRFISNRHWYPDYQLRLFRNLPSLIQFAQSPHDVNVVAGESRRITRAWIEHWDLVWHSRELRESKIAFYEEWSPWSGASFYRYEDYEYETRPLNYIHDGAHKLTPRVPVGRFSVLIDVLDCPSAMHAGELVSVLLAVTNNSDRLLTAASVFVRPPNVFVSYHWYRMGEPPLLHEWDGHRSPLPVNLQPGESTELFMPVKVPTAVGNYLLQPDLLEENVTWYSYHRPTPMIPITVTDNSIG
jgi:glycosyltransferase involved in cell wall biosynthesis